MAWKDTYSEDFTNEEMRAFEVIENIAAEKNGRLPNTSELSRALNLTGYKTSEIKKRLKQKGLFGKEKNDDGIEEEVLKGSRLLKEKTKIYKEIPGVFKGKKQLKCALIPYIRNVKNPNNIFNPDNILEYIAVPFNFQREENMFAFNIPKRGYHSAKKALNIGSIAIVDTKSEYLSKDIVAKLYLDKNIIALDEYFMYKEKENEEIFKKDNINKYIILGKVIGVFKSFNNI